MTTILTSTLIVTLALSLFFGGFYLKDNKGLWISGIGSSIMILFGAIILMASPIVYLNGENQTYIYGDNYTSNNWDVSTSSPNQSTGSNLFYKEVINIYTPISDRLNYILGIIFILLGIGGTMQLYETQGTRKLDKSEKEY